MSNHYVLHARKAVDEPDLMKWAAWFECANRTVEKTIVASDVYILTIFLGLDHQFGDGPPLLFETRIFGGERDQECFRYSTYEQAENGHKHIVAEHIVAELNKSSIGRRKIWKVISLVNDDPLIASEALYGFAGWLASRSERTVLSSSDDAGIAVAVELVVEFCEANHLAEPREGWHDNLVHP